MWYEISLQNFIKIFNMKMKYAKLTIKKLQNCIMLVVNITSEEISKNRNFDLTLE